MNNQRLLAGFFRYHREKLNYSQRGLVDENELSSLNAFEHNKLILPEHKLIKLFKLIGFDYFLVINSNDYEFEYSQIVEYIFSGEINEATLLYRKCVNEGVFNSLGCINFLFLSYLLPIVKNRVIPEYSKLVLKCESILTEDQITMIKVSDAISFYNSGMYKNSISILLDAASHTYNISLKMWINSYIGIAYCNDGDYYNAQRYTEEALNYYSSCLNFKRMIQLSVNLGTICSNSNSKENSERYYLKAFEASLKLKDAYKVMTKSYHCLFWLYFKTNQLDKIQELLMNIPADLEPIENTYFVLAWSNYKLGNKDEAIRYAVEGKAKYADNKYACTVYQYIENAAKGIKSNQDKLLNRAITMEDYEHNKEIDELFTMELIDIYEGRNTFESVKKANKLYRKLLNRK